MIKEGIHFLWAGSVASIPSNWERDTNLDGVYIKGTSGEASVTPIGSNSHSHTSPNHTHTMFGHSHSGNTSSDGAYETAGGSYQAARNNHYHNWSSNTTSGGSLVGSLTYSSVDFQPSNYKYIFIRPKYAQVDFANGMVALWGSSTVPSGFTFCDGTGGTTDLRNKFVKGALAGADGSNGSETGSHIHSVTHSHGTITHTHTGTSGNDSDIDPNKKRDLTAGGGPCVPTHTHTINLYANSAESSGAYSGNSPSKSTEPTYRKLVPIQNTSGGPSQVVNMIGIWVGTLATIPRGWHICDGTNGTTNMSGYYCKTVNTVSEVGNIGGESSHSHSASNSHTHGATSSHTHNGIALNQSESGTTKADSSGVSKGHSHNIQNGVGGSSSSNTSSWNSTTILSNPTDNELYRVEINFIQLIFTKGGLIQAV